MYKRLSVIRHDQQQIVWSSLHFQVGGAVLARRKLNIIVNAVPMTRIQTGIGRYLHCLYTELTRVCPDELNICYFDGSRLLDHLPAGPAFSLKWACVTDVLWRLPTRAALSFRLMEHYKNQMLFSHYAKGFDLYHESGFFPFTTPREVKTVFTIHDMSLARFPEHHPDERVRFFNLMFRRSLKYVDQFITVSDFSETEIQHFLPETKPRICVTPLACDTDFFYRRPPERTQATLKQLNIPDTYFLFVGSGDPRKNCQLAARALETAAPGIPLVIAGWNGWDTAPAPNILPVGYVDDDILAHLYSGARALLHPSVYEGFGLTLLEAMACGCPVIASHHGSLPEVAGNAVLYIHDLSTPSELAARITQLLNDPGLEKEMVQNGNERIRAFTWRRTAEKTRELFWRSAG